MHARSPPHPHPSSPSPCAGDYFLLLALADSLVEAGTSDATHQAGIMALACDPTSRRFTPYAELLLDALQTSRAPLAALPHLAHDFLAASIALASSTSSDRAEREPYGPSDYGAAARIAPLALAYRTAPLPVLEAAVGEACLMSHSHPLGHDGAHVAAAAVHWLLSRSAAGSRPEELLDFLTGVARTDDMRDKLALMRASLLQVGALG